MVGSTFDTSSLLILGSSVRAAAMSALRAGYQPTCADVFADHDLRQLCPVTQSFEYPHDLLAIAAQAPPGPWMYTGAMENHVEAIAAIAAVRTLYGNDPQALTASRDPAGIDRVLRAAGLDSPAIAETADDLPRDGTWIRKRRHSGGGFGIAPLTEDTDLSADDEAEHFYQQRVEGRSVGAMYIGARGEARFVGATAQSLSGGKNGSAGYHYVGSVGPLDLSATVQKQFERIGSVFAEQFGLVGVFGVDALIDDERVWPIEINPRFTASVEVLEWAYDVSFVDWHVEACRDGRLPPPLGPRPAGWFGKHIVYADRSVTIDADFVAWAEQMNAGRRWPVVADIPVAGAKIEKHRPVLTVLARAADETRLESALREAVAAAEAKLYGKI